MAKVLSIEIKSSKIRVAEIEKRGKRSRIVSCFRFLLPPHLVEDGFIRNPEEVGQILKEELEKRKLHKVKNVHFSIYSTRIAGKEVYLPYVKKKRIFSMIELNASEYFPIDVSQYVLSYDVIDIIEKQDEGSQEQNKKPEKQYRLMVYATPKALTSCYHETAQYAELHLMGMDYSSNSVYQVMKKEHPEGVHMLLKIERKESVITIVRDGKLSLQRSVNYGIDQALETIAATPVFGTDGDYVKGWEVLREKKCLYPTLDFTRFDMYKERDPYELWEAKCEVTEGFRYLIGNISRIMDYYLSRNAGVEFQSISYAGAGCAVKGLNDLLTEELGQEVKPLTSLKDIKYDESISEQRDSLGVFIAHMGSMYSDVNIMELTVRKKNREKENLGGAWLIFGIGTVSALILAGVGITNNYLYENERDRLNSKISENRDVEDVYNAYISQKKTYDELTQMLEYTKTPNENFVQLLEEMEEKMPSSIVVDSLSSTGTDLNFSARVPSKAVAAKVISQLRTFESITNISVASITKNENGEYSFSITCTYIDQSPIALSQEGEE